MTTLNIGQAAKASGISSKMIRHYEEIGLIPKARRTEAGYRLYSDKDIHNLIFVRHARDLGFPINTIRDLLSLWSNKRRSSSKVKALATEYLNELEQRIQELTAMKEVLQQLTDHCHGDDRPECPILDGIERGL